MYSPSRSFRKICVGKKGTSRSCVLAKDPTHHGFWYAAVLGPWDQNLRSLCLSSNIVIVHIYYSALRSYLRLFQGAVAKGQLASAGMAVLQAMESSNGFSGQCCRGDTRQPVPAVPRNSKSPQRICNAPLSKETPV